MGGAPTLAAATDTLLGVRQAPTRDGAAGDWLGPNGVPTFDAAAGWMAVPLPTGCRRTKGYAGVPNAGLLTAACGDLASRGGRVHLGGPAAGDLVALLGAGVGGYPMEGRAVWDPEGGVSRDRALAACELEVDGVTGGVLRGPDLGAAGDFLALCTCIVSSCMPFSSTRYGMKVSCHVHMQNGPLIEKMSSRTANVCVRVHDYWQSQAPLHSGTTLLRGSGHSHLDIGILAA